MTKPRPQPPYARLNQPPRSPNGRNRFAAAKNHSDPLDGAGASAGGAKQNTVAWSILNSPSSFLPGGVTYIDPGASPFLSVLSQSQFVSIYYGIDLVTEPPPIPYTGIHSGEITGHRAWLVTDTYDLCSLAHYFVWEPGKTVEGDVNQEVWRSPSGKYPPRFGGVYAYSSFDLLRHDELLETMKQKGVFPQQQRINAQQSITDLMIFGSSIIETVTYLGLAYGTVKLWGETVEHEKGYRASFAKLTSIDGFIGVKGFDLEKLREKYLG